MRLLLDTHTVLWFLGGNNEISGKARTLIMDSANQPMVSIVSLWEMAIKFSIGKLRLEKGLLHLFGMIENNGFQILPLTEQHILTVATLNFNHRDPFDRVLIAQALVEKLVVLTGDNEFKNYKVNIIW